MLTFSEHTAFGYAVSWSPGGRRIASGDSSMGQYEMRPQEWICAVFKLPEPCSACTVHLRSTTSSRLGSFPVPSSAVDSPRSGMWRRAFIYTGIQTRSGPPAGQQRQRGAEIARELRINPSNLYRWRAEYGQGVGGSPAKRTELEAQLKRLRRENEVL